MRPASTVTVLDESKQRRHGILSVGGIVLDLANLNEVEATWQDARLAAGIDSREHIKYSMSWPEGPQQRKQLIETIGRLPLKAVAALLEDFRPLRMKARKATRGDVYVQRRAFEWTLQRLAGGLFAADDSGPHIVMIDDRDDFHEFEAVYAQAYFEGWPDLPRYPLPPLQDRRFAGSLSTCSHGPLHEISDLLTSCTTRWADERCSAHKGGKPQDLEELDACMASLVQLFPVGATGVPPRRRGYSIVAHAGGRTGRELLRDNLDRWMHELDATASGECSE
jgi:hypothetical protein